MKRFFALFLIIVFAYPLAACGEDTPPAVPVDVGATPAPSDAAEPAALTEAPRAGSYGRNPAATVDDAVALVYEGDEGVTLYGSCAYTNTGDCPITIESAAFTFTVGGAAIEHSFAPPLGEYAVLMPGETSFLTAWLPQDADSETALSPGAEASLSAKLTARRAEAARTLLTLDHLYLADNYPNFTTLSGRITCAGALGCDMNVIHLGFYDADGGFLGAWYFTKNMLLEGSESKDFVVQMRGLPLPALSERAESVSAMGFGFTL